ncbi:hypothetical protein C4D60_Mb00t19890 [Musa balbisiana]|uniref:Uncharacterized protein n=1 Tax=Musa balbisiana TaxID=52838 RepID=A0A4S8I278_MUSBA|nr:hypothetical protein C4D60_Mb00t19890 [Musa balbisiana]
MEFTSHINAFPADRNVFTLDLSGFFDKSCSYILLMAFSGMRPKGNRVFTSDHRIPKDCREECGIVTEMGVRFRRGMASNAEADRRSTKSAASLSLATEVFPSFTPSVCVVELRKSQGDSSLYRKCVRGFEDLGASKGSKHASVDEESLTTQARQLQVTRLFCSIRRRR